MITVIRYALRHRSGLNIEGVVGEPQMHRTAAVRLGEDLLGMYASKDRLTQRGTRTTVAAPIRHPPACFVDSMLQVEDFDAPGRSLPMMRDPRTSTNNSRHVEATRVGAGIGSLSCFLTNQQADLLRLLPEHFTEKLRQEMVMRLDSYRRPAVAAVADALRIQTVAYQGELMGNA